MKIKENSDPSRQNLASTSIATWPSSRKNSNVT